jgi:hypothetical protein
MLDSADKENDQMSFDLEQAATNAPETASIPQETAYQKMLRRHGITEDELDEYAEKRGSYRFAFKHFGITDEELAALDAPEIPTAYGVSVNLGKRAVHLLGALKEYSAASRSEGFDRALHTIRQVNLEESYDPKTIGKILKKTDTAFKRGEKEFDQAFGSRALIDGDFDPEEVMRYRYEDRSKFLDSFTGPGTKSEREKLRRRLRRQTGNK